MKKFIQSLKCFFIKAFVSRRAYAEYLQRCEFSGREPESKEQFIKYQKEHKEIYKALWERPEENWQEIVRIETNLCV